MGDYFEPRRPIRDFIIGTALFSVFSLGATGSTFLWLEYNSTNTFEKSLDRERQDYQQKFDQLDLNKDGVLNFQEYLPSRLID